MPNLFLGTDACQPARFEEYKELLTIAGSLSRCFSDNVIPFLDPRIAENLFCKSFHAQNKARNDISADALLGKMGFGIKTFVCKTSGAPKFEKIAEFNRQSADLQRLEPVQMARRLAELRNDRINATRGILSVETMIYHCICRSVGCITIHESNMDLIESENLGTVTMQANSLSFSDGIHEYKYNKSKSTLFRRFSTSDYLEKLTISIVEDPWYLLRALLKDLETGAIPHAPIEEIVLPMYAYRTWKVPVKSGLNAWNGGGRDRHQDEVYLSIPSIIRDAYKGFFPGPETSFDLALPNGSVLSAKVCQQGNKALMSNPNRDLGHWILRDILNVKPDTLVTYADLERIGIDSVRISKKGSTEFEMTFAQLGSFDEFVTKLLD